MEFPVEATMVPLGKNHGTVNSSEQFCWRALSFQGLMEGVFDSDTASYLFDISY